MFISDFHLITSSLAYRPSHGPQIQVVYVFAVFTVFVCDTIVVSAKEIHVIFVDNGAVIRDWSRNMVSVACSLHEAPFVSTYQLTITFIIFQFVEARQVQFIERIQ